MNILFWGIWMRVSGQQKQTGCNDKQRTEQARISQLNIQLDFYPEIILALTLNRFLSFTWPRMFFVWVMIWWVTCTYKITNAIAYHQLNDSDGGSRNVRCQYIINSYPISKIECVLLFFFGAYASCAHVNDGNVQKMIRNKWMIKYQFHRAP